MEENNKHFDKDSGGNGEEQNKISSVSDGEQKPEERESEDQKPEEQKPEEQKRVIRLDSGKEIAVPVDEKKLRSFVDAAVCILAAAVLRGVGTYCFVTPNGFAVGGVAGIAVMLEYVTGINLGYFNLLINIPLLVLAFFFLSKRYFFATGAYTLLYSVVTIAIEQLNKLFDGRLIYHDSDTAIISAVFGGVMCGFAFCFMVRAGGSQGGTDIIAAIVQKRRKDIGISWVIFVIDSSIILLSFFVYDNGLTPILLAIIEAFSSGAVSDKFLKGSKSALKAEIVTNHCEEISAEIFEKLGKGVTVVDAVGQYTGNEHKLLNCVIKRRQLGDLERILKKYPDTFSYIMPANEVYGFWKK